MHQRLFIVILILAGIISSTVLLNAEDYSTVIQSGVAEYTIAVDGTRDPVNEAIIIENIGDVDIVNPRISINGRYDWFDLESITREAIAGCETDEEKAMAIWRFVSEKCHYNGAFGDKTLLNPVRLLNITGSNHCGYWASAVVVMAEQAGLQARVWEITQHTVPEIFFNGRWHLLDSRVGGNFGLLRDNRTIASVADLESDPFYMDRCLMRHPDYWGSHKVAMLYITRHDNFLRSTISKNDDIMRQQRTMACTLRPGEKLIRYFKPGDKWAGWGPGGRSRPGWKSRRNDAYGNVQPTAWGQLVLKPDLNKFPLSRFSGSITSIWKLHNVRTTAEDGREPALHVDVPRSMEHSRAAAAGFQMRSPWPIIGGSVSGRAYAYGASSLDTAFVGIGAWNNSIWKNQGWGSAEFQENLDRYWDYGGDGRYAADVTFSMYCPPDSIPYEQDYRPPVHDRLVQAGLEELTLTADIQVAPKSVPALSLGDNVVQYRDETPGSNTVRITHVWTERFDNHPPQAPAHPELPARGGLSNGLTPVFRWEQARDADTGDDIVDYHIFISLNPKCLWPLSPNFDFFIESDTPEFQMPEGWLNPNTTYYWKVRALDSRECLSPWSEIWSFTTP